MLVLVRDPEGKWRDEALLSTDATLTAAEVIRWLGLRAWFAVVKMGREFQPTSRQLAGNHRPAAL